MSETAIIVTLPDGTTHRAIEVEVETRIEGPGHMGSDVPYVVPVDWREDFEDVKPHTVRLFALVNEVSRCGECGGTLVDHRCADCATVHNGPPEPEDRVVDLMAALEQSIAEARAARLRHQNGRNTDV